MGFDERGLENDEAALPYLLPVGGGRGQGIPLPVPAEEEADAGRKQAGAETTVEPGEEAGRDTGNMLQSYAQGDHKKNDEIAFDAESPENAGLLLCHRHNAGRILPHYTCKHHIEPGEYQDRERYYPNQSARTFCLAIA